MKRLDSFWYSQNPLVWLLLPLSWLYCTLSWVRRHLYAGGMIASTRVLAPLVIVGNISVGGTGKTPLLIALCELLKRRGLSVGVVSRGYGAENAGVHVLADDDNPRACGDEPLLIRQRTGCPVVIGRDRVAAARRLLEIATCDVILSDDGLQHYRLQRDVEIAVVDAERGFGNGRCLPAGPLREPVSRLQQVDMVVWHRRGLVDDTDIGFCLEFGDVVNLTTHEARSLANFRGQRVHAVAGIGYPPRFFRQLRDAGLDVTEHAFADHHRYREQDLGFDDDLPVLMTEKDAVKCRGMQLPGLWKVPVNAKLSKALVQAFLDRVTKLNE
jgi:tetraacyldisaccharide 4'-kinase